MGTEVLQSQDILIERMRLNPSSGFPRRKPFYAGNSNPRSHRKPFIRSEPKKPVVRQVTILKRGEALVPKQIVVKNSNLFRSDEEVYAGSACYSSPSPKKLPLPTFSRNNLKSFDDSATKDLRRLLRLE